MGQYTDITNVENYTLKDVASSFESQVAEWIEAVSAFMDIHCNRTLVASGTAAARYFDGNGRDAIQIDDCQSIDAIQLGDRYGAGLSAVSSSDYITYPKLPPHRGLVLKSGVWTPGLQNVEITADWGYLAEITKDLEFAATVLVAGIINSHDPNAQGKKSERIGNYQVTYLDTKGITDYDRALTILDGYKRHEL